jgi:hypothetical protein
MQDPSLVVDGLEEFVLRIDVVLIDDLVLIFDHCQGGWLLRQWSDLTLGGTESIDIQRQVLSSSCDRASQVYDFML